MLMARNNNIRHNAILSQSGNITGNAQDILRPDFSRNITMQGNCSIKIQGSGSYEYVALHGLRIKKNEAITVELKIGGGSKYTQMLRPANGSVVFPFVHPDPSGDIELVFTAGAVIVWQLSYVAAGGAVIVPNGPVFGNQVYPYFQNNYESTNTTDQYAAPTGQIIRRIAPTVQINIPNAFIEFARQDIGQMYELSNELGVVSMLDYEDPKDVHFTRAWAAFGLQPTKVKADPRTNKLVNISMTFKAAF